MKKSTNYACRNVKNSSYLAAIIAAITTLHYLCFGHCVKSFVIVSVPWYFSSGVALPQKIPWSETISSDFTH